MRKLDLDKLNEEEKTLHSKILYFLRVRGVEDIYLTEKGDILVNGECTFYHLRYNENGNLMEFYRDSYVRFSPLTETTGRMQFIDSPRFDRTNMVYGSFEKQCYIYDLVSNNRIVPNLAYLGQPEISKSGKFTVGETKIALKHGYFASFYLDLTSGKIVSSIGTNMDEEIFDPFDSEFDIDKCIAELNNKAAICWQAQMYNDRRRLILTIPEKYGVN